MTVFEKKQPYVSPNTLGSGLEDQAFKERSISQSPFRLFVMISAAIFITEIIVMLFLFQLPSLSPWVRAFFDAVILIVLLIPALHFLILHPMRLYVTELFQTQKRLHDEITERKEAEKALRDSEKELRHLSSQVLAAQERERKRVSREVHEELGQTLAVVKMGLRSMEENWLKKGVEVGKEFEKYLSFIDLAIENVHRIHRELGPSIVEDLGLSVALQRLVNNLVKNCNMKVSLDLLDMDRFFSQRIQMIIYRILQEALANVETHSQATHLSVVVHQRDREISFSVKDNGRGFDVKQVMAQDDAGNRLGLATMFEAAKMAGGSFNIGSEAGEGTHLTFTIPIEKEESPH